MEPTDYPAETRTFQFPNGGHSVRKLSLALAELGATMVSLKVLDMGLGYQVSFVEDTKWGKVNASKLAVKVLTLGTRFTLDVSSGTPRLKFHTDFSDIMAYPETYGIA